MPDVTVVRGGVHRVLEHNPPAAGGLRVRSMYDHSWGGNRFYLVHPTEERYATEQSFLSEQGARDAVASTATPSPTEDS